MRNTQEKSLEKRLKRIERWLKRCMVACRCGSWSSALMEIECMEAETQGFRDDLWKTVEAEANGYPVRSRISKVFFAARVAAVSLVFVMAVGLPLSVDQDRPFQGFNVESLALLTSTESEILSALRHSLSSANEGRVILSVEIPEERSETSVTQGAAMAEEERAEEVPVARPVLRNPAPQRPRVEVVAAETPQKREGPSVEEVLSLIQVGERALRLSEPAVRGLP
ncbi:hypothetical protein LJC31_05175 [Synergistaceae bacterium OttesenSCG-928-I11]|nr:hypothetical protein [Synergistaceae bacterium OttesenSCG-928-I11]